MKYFYLIALQLPRNSLAAPKGMEHFAQPGIGQFYLIFRLSPLPAIVRRIQQVAMFRIKTLQSAQQRPAVKPEAGGVVEISFCVKSDRQSQRCR